MEALVLLTYLLALVLVASLLRVRGRPDRVLTPIAFFVGVEVVAVWPALVPSDGSIIELVGSYPALLAAVGMLAMVLTYIVLGGSAAVATGWRHDGRRPSAAQLRSMSGGLTLLVAGLVALGLVSFNGLPPLLTGGIGALLDPANNADQVAVIRETRLSLTKGHTLLGDAYAGQGVINAATEVGWRVAVIVATLCWTWGRSRQWLWGMVVVDALAFVFLASAGSRSPLILCGIAAAAALAIRFRLQTRGLVATVVLASAFVVFIMPLSKGAAEGESVIERSSAAVERVTDGNGQNNAHIVRLVTAGNLEVQYGGLFVERLRAMVPGTSAGDPFALRITRLAYGASEQTTGYSTPTQYGLLYADGGASGVLVGYILSGGVLAVAWRRIVRIRSPFGAVVAVEGGIVLGLVSVSGIHGLLSAIPVAAFALLVAAGPAGWSAAVGAAGRARTKAEQPS